MDTRSNGRIRLVKFCYPESRDEISTSRSNESTKRQKDNNKKSESKYWIHPESYLYRHQQGHNNGTNSNHQSWTLTALDHSHYGNETSACDVDYDLSRVYVMKRLTELEYLTEPGYGNVTRSSHHSTAVRAVRPGKDDALFNKLKTCINRLQSPRDGAVVHSWSSVRDEIRKDKSAHVYMKYRLGKRDKSLLVDGMNLHDLLNNVVITRDDTPQSAVPMYTTNSRSNTVMSYTSGGGAPPGSGVAGHRGTPETVTSQDTYRHQHHPVGRTRSAEATTRTSMLRRRVATRAQLRAQAAGAGDKNTAGRPSTSSARLRLPAAATDEGAGSSGDGVGIRVTTQQPWVKIPTGGDDAESMATGLDSATSVTASADKD